MRVTVNKPTITRRLQFCAGHRLVNHEGKCAMVHGHNYVALITCEAYHLDHVGRVIDFAVVKAKVGGWIEQHWDHGFIANIEDAAVVAAMRSLGQKLYLMECNPTAENMAEHLRLVAQGLLDDHGLNVSSVLLYETENCFAESRR